MAISQTGVVINKIEQVMESLFDALSRREAMHIRVEPSVGG